MTTGCSSPPPPAAGGVTRIAYGSDPSQWADLHRPAGTPRGVVVVVHGGFWRAQYDATLGTPLADALAAEGWAAWNLEYRRVGNGGGVPATLEDVSAGVDALGGTDLDLTTVLGLGHSAGGHLAVWAAGRSSATVPLTGVVSQAGVLDLRAAAEASLGGGAVQDFVGGPPDASVDPLQQIPLAVPVRCIHGRSDGNVPLSQSQSYVASATAAGADATLTEVDGDHFVLIDPSSPVWQTQLDLLADLAG
ncbi:alpha/beta hydrolase family protein [Klenkia soli]|uniref:alpha/beta hydrolase family protein n=1 Tax=Klenkia soli TaxID=1052260 RepID=UPI001A95C596|nr:prolyl oligopeptidase family serine peptidase [Klenkia soli]